MRTFQMLTGAVYHHGVPPDVCHTASSHHTGGSLYRHHGEGNYMKHFISKNQNNVHTSEISNAYLIFCMIQSWWVWDGTESSDLWYNCRFDNETEAWSCATSEETGKITRLST